MIPCKAACHTVPVVEMEHSLENPTFVCRLGPQNVIGTQDLGWKLRRKILGEVTFVVTGKSLEPLWGKDHLNQNYGVFFLEKGLNQPRGACQSSDMQPLLALIPENCQFSYLQQDLSSLSMLPAYKL